MEYTVPTLTAFAMLRLLEPSVPGAGDGRLADLLAERKADAAVKEEEAAAKVTGRFVPPFLVASVCSTINSEV